MGATGDRQSELMGEVAVTRKRLAEAVLAMRKLRDELGRSRNGPEDEKKPTKSVRKLFSAFDFHLSDL